MNKVLLIGNLTKDIELKTTNAGSVVGKGSMATNRTFINKDHQKQTEVQFHNLVVWGKMAETIAKYTKKGDKIYIEGEIKNSEYQKTDGTKGYKSEVLITSFEFLPNKRSNDQQVPNQVSNQESEDDQTEIKIEDIPF